MKKVIILLILIILTAIVFARRWQEYEYKLRDVFKQVSAPIERIVEKYRPSLKKGPAKKKASGSVRQHTTRPGKRLGIKVYGGQKIKNGGIIIRQRGSGFHPGDGVKMGRDFTLYAIKDGQVSFKKKWGKQMVCVV